MRVWRLFLGAAVASAAYVPGKAFDRFITIWLENQDFTAVEKNADIQALAKEGVMLTQYYGLTHPSQPNYIASIGGDYFGLNHDGFVRIPQNVSTLVDLLDTQNIAWRGYFEGLPGPGYMFAGSTALNGNGWDYVRKHNPFASYDSINLNGTRLANLLSFDDFDRDVKANTLPQYMHLSPDMLNDGHNTTLEYAATWSRTFLEPLLNNPQFMEKTLILLTYDESATYPIPNRIVSLLLGGAIPENLKGTRDDTVYTHYSILSTLENNWNLPNLGRYDVGANVFSFVASQTGYTRNHSPSNFANANNSLSYGGFLNTDPAKYKRIPSPNLQLVGAGGQGVERMVGISWAQHADEMTPYDGSGDLADGGDGVSSPNEPIYKVQAPAVT
ncbi:phosphoesterase-domain-containing protein [Mollisia scopiformis]|uniref:Phosphoesterase-domain-containing protein n=1 Tax=Mollisia scopiformis TaxID=149040 RepID=A0A194WZV6_MOLSC|nr:phosphoesterase-domain-containing protein [Mollisia scopiformis]KUJ13481.1 phosphoesterase-domain-containing protein [Mollisia scopiformis]